MSATTAKAPPLPFELTLTSEEARISYAIQVLAQIDAGMPVCPDTTRAVFTWITHVLRIRLASLKVFGPAPTANFTGEQA